MKEPIPAPALPPPPPAAAPAAAPAPVRPKPVSAATATATAPSAHSESEKWAMESKPKAANGKAKALPYREFLYADDNKVDTEVGLQSFVLFTHRPVDQDEKDRYLRTCHQWVSELEEMTDKAKEAAKSKGLAPTPLYWPSISSAKSVGCETLFNYDYARAAQIVARIGSGAAAMDGPLLALQRGNEWMVLDISRFTPPDVERAFATWKQQVCKTDPMSGVAMAKFREYFRALVQTYGETILKSFEKVKIG